MSCYTPKSPKGDFLYLPEIQFSPVGVGGVEIRHLIILIT